MGKKKNLAYRRLLAERAQLDRCAYCGKRSRQLVRTPDGQKMHRTCSDQWAIVLVNEEQKGLLERAIKVRVARFAWNDPERAKQIMIRAGLYSDGDELEPRQ